jgi:hypothetical protein
VSLVPPPWEPGATRALAHAARVIRPIAAVTPLELAAELARVAPGWDAGRPEAPRFGYAPPQDHAELEGVLGRLAEALDPEGALGALYAARARELAVEAAMCAVAGSAALWAAARRRYAPRGDGFDAEADALAAVWLAELAEARVEDDALVRSDDESDPRSLVVRMREEAGARRLALRVVVLRDLASLAATGEGLVQIAAGRVLSPRDVERTVLHEIEGHALPRARASGARLGLFGVGSARGSDDQEGSALHLERAGGFLDRARRRELALRHEAARSVERGADFVETGRALLARGAPVADVLRIASRVHRGGGLAREAVYLPALLRVEAALAREPELDAVLSIGRVSVDVAPALREWLE